MHTGEAAYGFKRSARDAHDERGPTVVKILVASALVALAMTPAALAQGGGPSVAYPLPTTGQVVGGDTSRQTPDIYGTYREFWSTQLKAGDYITVDWSQPAGGENQLSLLPPGTNDDNWSQAEYLARRTSDSTGHDEFTLTI